MVDYFMVYNFKYDGECLQGMATIRMNMVLAITLLHFAVRYDDILYFLSQIYSILWSLCHFVMPK